MYKMIIIPGPSYLRSLFRCAKDGFFVTSGSGECKDDRSCQKDNNNTVPNHTSCARFQF